MSRWRKAALGVGALLVAACALAGCPGAHDDYPSTTCKSDSECYVGEMCVDNVCMVPVDMTVPVVPYDFSGLFATDGGTDGGGGDL